jgi:FAD/FMN-containing dehydrogenase
VKTTDLEAAEWFRELFAQFQPRIVKSPLFDFSRLHSGIPVFCEVSPASECEVSGVVRMAREHRVRLRTRGNGHTLNGSSLPRPAELVVHTGKLAKVIYQEDAFVSTGAGTMLWSVDAWLRTKGYSLPVMNDGYAGPSVGGFVAAGGFGPGSRISGGTVGAIAICRADIRDGNYHEVRHTLPPTLSARRSLSGRAHD